MLFCAILPDMTGTVGVSRSAQSLKISCGQQPTESIDSIGKGLRKKDGGKRSTAMNAQCILHKLKCPEVGLDLSGMLHVIGVGAYGLGGDKKPLYTM